MKSWHTLDVRQSLESLQSKTEGLSDHESAQRIHQYGHNELEDKGIKNPFIIIFEQLTSLMVVILIAAGVFSLFLGRTLETVSIFSIIILFVTLGFIQEYRAEKAIAALKKMSVPKVRVRRNGKLLDVAARDLVPGDIVILEAGSSVPADLRIIESANLKIQESALTGESEGVEKQVDALANENIVIGNKTNMAFMGTAVSYGRGVGLVVTTGMKTELGNIADMLQNVEQSSTPLQQKLDKVGLFLAVAGLAVAGLIVLIGFLSGGKFQEMILTAISVAVAVVPEGLPAIMTFTLAMGAQRMLKRNALIRKLPAVETLGSVSVICSDKTGTLTENKMTVTIIDVSGHSIDVNEKLVRNESALKASSETVSGLPPWLDSIDLVLLIASLCNDAEMQKQESDGSMVCIGDPTETALLVAAEHRGFKKETLSAVLPRNGEFPFDSERKRMSTFHVPIEGKKDRHIESILSLTGLNPQTKGLVFTKGAVDGLLPLCTKFWAGSSIEILDEEHLKKIKAKCDAMAAKGMRVLGFAFRTVASDITAAEYEKDLVFVGMTAIIDPPRPEVKEAVAHCLSAGIRPIMITGDHPLTASYIAAELGISTNGKVITGADLFGMNEEALRLALAETSVYARVSPEHKLRIVNSLQAMGHVVAMTGDGVNDAPALKKADIGVAMGITGTDVSKEAAAMVLRDDNFATIVAAVEEGRSIYDNIRSYIGFSVAGNLGKIAFMLLWPLLFAVMGLTLTETVALLPLQLLWLNLLTDGLLGLAIGLEPVNKLVMSRPPINRKKGIFSDGMGFQILRIGMLESLISLGVGVFYKFQGLPQWQTMVVLVMSFMQVGQALALRNPNISVFRSNPFGNRVLALMAVSVIGLQVLVLGVPVVRDALGMTAVSLKDFGIAICGIPVLMLLVELEKLVLGIMHKRKSKKVTG